MQIDIHTPDVTVDPVKPFVPARLKAAAKRKAAIKVLTKALRAAGVDRRLARAVAKRKAAGGAP